MKTKLVNNITNEARNQLHYYKNLYLTRKNFNKISPINISTNINHSIAIHVYCYLFNLLIKKF